MRKRKDGVGLGLHINRDNKVQNAQYVSLHFSLTSLFSLAQTMVTLIHSHNTYMHTLCCWRGDAQCQQMLLKNRLKYNHCKKICKKTANALVIMMRAFTGMGKPSSY